MKSGLGSLLLVAGTVCGSLAAASNERAWKRVALADAPLGDPAVVLFADVVPAGGSPEAEAASVEGAPATEPLARAGEPLSAEVVEALRATGATSVRVRRMARTSEEVAVAAGLEGRILAEAVYVDDAGGEVVAREAAAERIALAEAARSVLTEAGPGARAHLTRGADGSWSASLEASEGAERVVDAAELEPLARDARLAGLPPLRTLAPAGRYVDGTLAAALTDGGLETVRVRIPKPKFSIGAWPGLIPFVLSVVAMLGGVILLRAGRREALSAAEDEARDGDELSPAERLATIVAGVEAVADAAGDLDAPALLARVDPLLSVECLAFVEARDRLRLALGGRDYAAVMSPFATGERRLARAWSAAADGHAEEARASLAEAVEPLELALETLARVTGAERRIAAATVGATDGAADGEDGTETTR